MPLLLKKIGYFIKDNPKVSAMILVGLLVVILFGYQQCSNQAIVNQKETEIEQLKEQQATESQKRVDEAKSEVNTAKDRVKEVQQTDSNKYSSVASDATNVFCTRYCNDSSCETWREEQRRLGRPVCVE